MSILPQNKVTIINIIVKIVTIPYTTITSLIFIFVRACVHYAMFEDEYYLKSQMEVLKQGVALFADNTAHNT